MFEEALGNELLIFLGTAGVVVPLFGKLRFGVVPGFLIAGVLLGPGGLGRLAGDLPWLGWVTVSDPDRMRPFAELGVLFLLFLIGLEFSFERLWAMRRFVLGVGSLQFFASVVALLGGALLIGIVGPVALVAGLALALSSTATVTQVLFEARRMAQPVGRLALGVLLFQDLMVVPIVIVIGLLGGEEVAAGGVVVEAIGLAVAAIAAIILAGRFLARPLLRIAAATGSRDLVVAIALFLAIGTALLTSAAGLSSALGAFLAGLLLGESEYRHQLEVDIEPFKGLLLGLFFMTVGMGLNLAVAAVVPLAFVAVLVAFLAVKAVIMFGAARVMGVDVPVAVEGALVMAGAGEFAFVVFTLAGRHAILGPGEVQFLIALAAVSMLAIPLLAGLGQRAAAAVKDRQDRTRHPLDGGDGERLADHVVIGGFGRVGRVVARLLDAEAIPYVALDLDGDLIAEERRAGHAVYYGDAGRREILDRVGGARARAFVVTTNEPLASERMVKAIRQAWPAAIVHARARDSRHAARLAALGVTGAVPETLEGSLQLGAQLLIGIGLPEEAVDARITVARAAAISRLAAGKGD